MHARQLIEIAGFVSLHAPPLVRSGATVCGEALSEYWIASRCRLDAWGRTLRTLGHSGHAPPVSEAGDLLSRLAEEIVLSETLARVMAGVCLIHDAHHRGEEAGPIGANTLVAHRESASRLRALIFAWWAADSPRARHARSLAKRAEHWTDMLLAYVAQTAEVERLAYDVSRLREYAYDSQQHGGESSRGAAQLLRYALQSNFATATQPPLTPDLNRRIAGAAMGLFGPDGYDGHGLAAPTWMLRAERTADETAALVDRLFEEHDTAAANRLPARWRI